MSLGEYNAIVEKMFMVLWMKFHSLLMEEENGEDI
jgi:hypothetical protein